MTGQLPQIRIVDSIAAGGLNDGVGAAGDRLVEFTITELERLLQVLGAEGLAAFCAYVKVMRREAGPDGRPILVVDEFSGRWVQEQTSLGRNAAYRAQNALEASGLFDRLVSRPGQGARGKQRARINPGLVLVPGGADGDVEGLRRRSSTPGSRKLGTREPGGNIPRSQQAGTWEGGVDSQVPAIREPGSVGEASVQVSAVFPELGTVPAGSTSSDSPLVVVNELLSSDSGPGLLRRVLAPAIRRNPDRVAERLHGVFNKNWLAERTEELVVPLRMDGTRTQRAEQLVQYLCSALAGELDPRVELTKLKVQGKPKIPDTELAERIVAGLVVGLGMRPAVSSWGAWLNTVTKPGWSPKPNAVLDRFVAEIRRLETDGTAAGRKDPAATGSGNSGFRAHDLVEQGTVAGPDNGDDETGQPGESTDEPRPLLPEEAIAEHFRAARERFPFLCREGSPSATDPAKRSLLVRMYLEDVEKEEILSDRHMA